MRITVTFTNIQGVTARLDEIQQAGGENIKKQLAKLAEATEEKWKTVTPSRTNRLRSGDKAVPADFTFVLENPVFYYKFVDEGHLTKKFHRTREGHLRPLKQRRVPGKHITEPAIKFIEQNLEPYLSTFLENV